MVWLLRPGRGEHAGWLHSGMISESNVLISEHGTTPQIVNESSFELVSGYLTGALGYPASTRVDVEVQGFSGGTLVYDNIYGLTTTNATLIHFGFIGIDTAKFVLLQNPLVLTGFELDDLAVNVPEPGGPALWSFAALCIAWLRAFRRNQRGRLSAWLIPPTRVAARSA